MNLTHLPSFTLVLVFATMPSVTEAQEPSIDLGAERVAIGSRIRFKEPGRHGLLRNKRTIIGRLTAADEDSVTILPSEGPTMRVYRGWLEGKSLQVSLGRPRRILKGGAIGGAILLGVALLANAGPGGCGLGLGPCPKHGARDEAAISALAGFAIGAAKETFYPAEKWRNVPTPQSLGDPPGSGSSPVPHGATWRVQPTCHRGASLRLSVSW